MLGVAIAALIALLALTLALSPAVQAADQTSDQTSPFVAQDADDDDDDGVLNDDDDDAITDDDETPAPAETGNAGALGGVAGGQSAVPQDADDDDAATDDEDDGVLDDEDDGITDDDDEAPAPAETGSAGLLGGQGAGSAGLVMLLAGAGLALLSGARFALSRR